MQTTGVALLALSGADAVAAAFKFSDGVCEYRVRYNPGKVDGSRIKSTFDYLTAFTPPNELPPSAEVQADVPGKEEADIRARCAAHRQKLEAFRLLALPGIEELRRHDVHDLDDSCRIGAATLAATKGDVAPMRTHAPACVRWADMLALPAAALKVKWNDLVADLCTTSTQPNICTGQLQRDGEGPGSEVRRRRAVIARWRECASPPKGDEMAGDRERERLKEMLMKRFGAKALSCAQ